MSTVTALIADERRPFTEPLEVVRRAAEEDTEPSLPELLEQIDATHALIAEQFMKNAKAEEQASATRLLDKLLALRERLVYADFGPDEQRALRGVLTDLDELVDLRALKGATIATARTPVGDQAPRPSPPDHAMSSQGSYYLRWELHRRQG